MNILEPFHDSSNNPVMKSSWEKKVSILQGITEDVTTQIFERKQASKAQLDVTETTEKIKSNMEQLRSGIADLEQELETAEHLDGGPKSKEDLKKWESAILNLSKQYDRLEFMSGASQDEESARKQLLSQRLNSSSRGNINRIGNPSALSAFEDEPEDLQNAEILQLHQRIMDDQDTHLEELGQAVLRQKQIGLMIGEELETQINMLEETENEVDSVQRRLDRAGSRLRDVHERAQSSSSGNMIIAGLVILLLLIVVWAKWLR